MSFDEKAARRFTGKFKPGDRVLMGYGSGEIPGVVLSEDPLEYDRSVMGYMVQLDTRPTGLRQGYLGQSAPPRPKETMWASERELRHDILSQLAQI